MPALRMMSPRTLPLNLSASAQAAQSAVKSSSSTPASASRSGNLGSSGQHIQAAAGKNTVTWSVGMVVVIQGEASTLLARATKGKFGHAAREAYVAEGRRAATRFYFVTGPLRTRRDPLAGSPIEVPPR